MGLNGRQLRTLIVRPALLDASLWTDAAENLVMGTAAQESGLEYVKQLAGGPALGLWQMEPATYADLWDNWLAGQPAIAAQVLIAAGLATRPPAAVMMWNLRYGALMCRVHYRRVPDPLPAAGDINAMAAYWKRWYNTPAGSGTVAQFVRNYALVKVA